MRIIKFAGKVPLPLLGVMSVFMDVPFMPQQARAFLKLVNHSVTWLGLFPFAIFGLPKVLPPASALVYAASMHSVYLLYLSFFPAIGLMLFMDFLELIELRFGDGLIHVLMMSPIYSGIFYYGFKTIELAHRLNLK